MKRNGANSESLFKNVAKMSIELIHHSLVKRNTCWKTELKLYQFLINVDTNYMLFLNNYMHHLIDTYPNLVHNYLLPVNSITFCTLQLAAQSTGYKHKRKLLSSDILK